MDFSTLIYWESPISTEWVLGETLLGLFGSREKLMLANSGDLDQMPHYVASDLGLYCLPIYPFYGFPTTMG